MSVYGKFDSPAQTEAHSDSAQATHPELMTPSQALPPEHHEHRRKKTTPGVAEQKSLWNTGIMRQAFIDAFRKLDPRGGAEGYAHGPRRKYGGQGSP